MKIFFKRPWPARELKRLAREGKPLSILDDVVFKAMLSADNDDSREALRSILSACTRRQVSSVQVVNNDLNPVHLEAKTARLDVHVTFNDGEVADLEMQASKSSDDLKKRAEYYTAMLVAGQQQRGKSYRSLKRVYQIFFLNDILFTHSDKVPRRYFYQEETEHDRFNDITEIIIYELPKLEQRLQDFLSGKTGKETLTKEEKWCIYLKYRDEERADALIKRLCREEKGIMCAEHAVYQLSRDYKRYARKMAEIKNSMDRAQALLEAREEGLATGHAEGLAVGHAEGLAAGHTEGLAEGHMAGHAEGLAAGHAEATLEIARRMKNSARPLSEIAEFTGLPVVTIEALR